MKTTLISPKELDNGLVDTWRAWQLEAGVLSNPFLSPSFALAYGRHQSRARIAVIEDSGELVGFLPIELTSLRSVRSMAWGLSDMQAPTFKPGYRIDAHALLKSGGFPIYEFDRMRPEFADQFGGSEVKRVLSPVIEITNGY